EARAIAGDSGADAPALARAIHALGPRCVVVTGGHREQAVDVFYDGEALAEIPGERHPDGAAHGSGCTHSSALAAHLAHGFTPHEAASIKRALSVGSLVSNFAPLVTELLEQLGASGTVADLARMSSQDWVALVGKTGLPPDFVPPPKTDPATAYAARMTAAVGDAFPTATMAARVASFVPAPEQRPVAQFFANNPDLELVSQNLAVYLESAPGAFKGISERDRETVIATARTMQRVLRIAPTPDVAHQLVASGITSATQIATLGKQQFVARAAAGGISEADAAHTYESAAQRYATGIAAYMKYHLDAVGVLPKLVGNIGDLLDPIRQAVQRDQSLATLFGSQDYCRVDDCTSVLSPAAYLCDLLLWLRNHPQGGHTALDVLDDRRPDIRHLLLDCPNTDTELPYIDLVNELLADKIAPPVDPSSTINPIWKQTSAALTAEQLRAAPQYFNQPAYVTLFDASYPHTLPYSAGLDELRTYLQQWNVPLWQLRQALLPLAGATDAQRAAVAGERLGLTTRGQSLVTVPGFVSAATAWNTSDFSTTGLAKVPVFLQAAAITYDQLIELLECTWVQGGLGIKLHGLNDSCDTSAMVLKPAPLDAGFLDRAHRFLRLWRATGYKMWELDLLLRSPSVGNGALDDAALVNLQAFWRLQSISGLAVDQVLAWYQNIDTGTHLDPDGKITTSRYAQIFLDPTVTWIAPDPDLVALPAGGPIGDPQLADHAKAIQPALGASAADLAVLVALTDGQLTLANLSALYRVTALAKAAKLSVSDLLATARLLAPTLAQPASVAALFASPAATLAFLQEQPSIATSGLSLDALTYLLTPPAPEPSPVTTTLVGGIDDVQTTIVVASDAGYPTTPFYIHVGAEIMEVTVAAGAGNATWTVVRGQQGTTAASASSGATVALAGNGGWSTTSQMMPADIASALGAVQQAIVRLLSASTTLVNPITAADLTLTVASDTGFPTGSFYVYIGTEILLVTGTTGAGNTTWSVVRGQLGTTAAPANAGASVTPTSGDLDGVVVSAVAGSAHPAGAGALATDVTALILDNVTLPGTTTTLLAALEDPTLVTPTGTIELTGTPVAGDVVSTVIAGIGGANASVTYTVTAAEAGDINLAASAFAAAIDASSAVTGPAAFLAPCSVSGAEIVLSSLTPNALDSNITCTNSTQPTAGSDLAVTPAVTTLDGVPAPTDANFPSQFRAIQLFDKVALLVRKLRLVASDASWLLANSAVYGGLDLHQLPVVTTQPALSLGSLETTLLLVKLARMFTAAPATSPIPTLYDVISAVQSGTLADAGQVQQALATITGWPLADIEAFAPALGLLYPASYTQPATYDALRTLEAMSAAVLGTGPIATTQSTALVGPIDNLQTSITVTSAIGFPAPSFYVTIGTEILLVTGVGGADNTIWTVVRGQQGSTAASAPAGAPVAATYGAQIVTWGSVPVDELAAESLAASALGALKAEQPTEAAWLALAPTLMDPIRERRAAALQAYLISQRDGAGNLIYGDTNGLFDYFLIDTQMSSCQVTSRVVQAYIAVQIFVERCLMSLETTRWGTTLKGVVVDLAADDTWDEWSWMKRYRVWEANREVFLFPENWLVPSQRPTRTETYQKLESDVRQNQATSDYFETVVLNYIDRLDGLANLKVTGTCRDAATDTIFVVARTHEDPPAFYSRSFTDGAWTGWAEIPLTIKSHQVVPAIYRGRPTVFWLEVKLSNEPATSQPPAQATTSSSTPRADIYASMSLNFSILRNGSWTPTQSAKGHLFDKPILDSTQQAIDTISVEQLYTIRVSEPVATPGLGAPIHVDVFRRGKYRVFNDFPFPDGGGGIVVGPFIFGEDESLAVHIGRGVFNGRFAQLELLDTLVPLLSQIFAVNLLEHAKDTYGPDAQPLVPLTSTDADLVGESGLAPEAGALAAFPDATTPGQTLTLNFPRSSILEIGAGPLITGPRPVRVVTKTPTIGYEPSPYFFYQDNARAYYVDVTRQDFLFLFMRLYRFRPFYHPFTRLFWNQLSGGGFETLYDPQLQQTPDNIDPGFADLMSFQETYSPTSRVTWDLSDVKTTLAQPINATQTTIHVTSPIFVPVPLFHVRIGSEILWVLTPLTNSTTWLVFRGQMGTTAAPAAAGATVTPTAASQDRQFLDFRRDAAFSVYNWELFYHVPLYIAQTLSQNQQFEDAQKWFHYVFDPTRQGAEALPQRFWIPKPLRDLTTAEVLAENIAKLLAAVDHHDPSAVAQIKAWRADPFDPYHLADLRPVAYMKATVMAYLDNLIAWGDNLFSSESREALSEATLLYVLASEILGPAPQAVTPPPHADMSYDQLEPLLDAFANAMVDIENVIGGTGDVIAYSSGKGSPRIRPHTFYFKIPPNPKLLGYWTTVDDRLYKLRHCQNIAGEPLSLALFDAPIDPGLLVAARAAGVDLSSVLGELGAPLSSYRFTALYPVALDFVNAVRAYGAALQAALEKLDAGALALLQQTLQQQLLRDGDDIFDWQIAQANDSIDANTAGRDLAQRKQAFNDGQDFMTPFEFLAMGTHTASTVMKAISAAQTMVGSVVSPLAMITFGGAGFGGSPVATATIGGLNIGHSAHMAGVTLGSVADITEAVA
ncbi:MAG TPA: neuraminidase-like domain-containing protein, partial [Kofleriaceae bacterium]|nr:neuraminidase-like domain-containing protein [Kofleriaceae bacterium]